VDDLLNKEVVHKNQVTPGGLTSDRDDSNMASSAVHLGPEEPAVLGDGVALDAAERVSRAAAAAHAEQDAWGGGGRQSG
jgi:hypothetical protein